MLRTYERTAWGACGTRNVPRKPSFRLRKIRTVPRGTRKIKVLYKLKILRVSDRKKTLKKEKI